MGTDELRIICQALDDEPMFHLSLQSKELFHSNFLAWICKSYPDSAVRVFSKWVPSNSDQTDHHVYRERNKLDIAVQLPHLNPFVIENKVFALPDNNQLDRYAAGGLAGFKDPVLLLLSLSPPTWPRSTHESSPTRIWHYISYTDLLNSLEESTGSISGFEGELVTHYCNYVRNLLTLTALTAFPQLDESAAIEDAVAQDLHSIRIFDGMSKLRSRQSIAMVRSQLDPEIDDGRIQWEALFSNSKPLLSAFWKRDDGDRLGWQYQEGQWRVVVITDQHKGAGVKLKKLRNAYVAEKYKSWFDFSEITELVDQQLSAPSKIEQSGGYHSFSPDFVYNYRKLPTLSLRQLIKLSNHYLLAAANYQSR